MRRGWGWSTPSPAVLWRRIDAEATALNDLTGCSPEDAKIPLVFATDRDAVHSLLTTVRPYTRGDLRLVYIKNSLELGRLWVSMGCLPQLEHNPTVTVASDVLELTFDVYGNLISPFFPL